MEIKFGDRLQIKTEKVKNVCCGCSACVVACPKNAISMEMGLTGFYIARIDKGKCIDCGMCIKICPIKEEKQERHQQFTVYALRVKDKLKRIASQSGGAYGVCAEEILHARGVLYGVVFEKNKAIYKRIESIDELEKTQGSKYIQAFVNNNIFLQVQEDLISGKIVLFSGTPCYVDGLKHYLNIMNVSQDNLYSMDLICHGVPSPMIFEEYIQLLEIEHKRKIENFNFRDKVWGWGPHVCSYTVGTKKIFSENFVNIFYSHTCLNESCYTCPYTNTNRVGDITIGDCWGIESSHPELNDAIGISMVLVNTEKGAKILEKIKERVVLQEIEIDYKRQPNLCKPTAKPENFENFWQLYAKSGLLKAAMKYCNYKESESELVGKIDWNLYQKLTEYLYKCGVRNVFLYGIGITMLQMICYIENEKRIQIKGLLDDDNTYVGRKLMGLSVWGEHELPEDNFVVVICSVKSEVITIIEKRLKAKEKYNAANFFHVNMKEIREIR